MLNWCYRSTATGVAQIANPVMSLHDLGVLLGNHLPDVSGQILFECIFVSFLGGIFTPLALIQNRLAILTHNG